MQLHDACTVPTLLYGSEAWIPTKDETTKIEAINNNILKRFLRTPKTNSKGTHFYGNRFDTNICHDRQQTNNLPCKKIKSK